LHDSTLFPIPLTGDASRGTGRGLRVCVNDRVAAP
jgi:hypothetical protein